MNEQPKNHHMIVILLILIILAALAYLVFALSRSPQESPVENTVSTTQPVVEQVARTATFALSPATKVTPVGGTFTVDVVLDTGGSEIYGIDLFSLRFDPKILQVVDTDTKTAGIQIKPGTLMDMNIANSVDNTKGTVQFSQLASVGSTFKGTGTIATLTFKTVSTGKSDVTLDFTLGSGTDSNVAGAKGDLLSGVINGSYEVVAK